MHCVYYYGRKTFSFWNTKWSTVHRAFLFPPGPECPKTKRAPQWPHGEWPESQEVKTGSGSPLFSFWKYLCNSSDAVSAHHRQWLRLVSFRSRLIENDCHFRDCFSKPKGLALLGTELTPRDFIWWGDKEGMRWRLHRVGGQGRNAVTSLFVTRNSNRWSASAGLCLLVEPCTCLCELSRFADSNIFFLELTGYEAMGESFMLQYLSTFPSDHASQRAGALHKACSAHTGPQVPSRTWLAATPSNRAHGSASSTASNSSFYSSFFSWSVVTFPKIKLIWSSKKATAAALLPSVFLDHLCSSSISVHQTSFTFTR